MFLGGAIDQGDAPDWQGYVIERLQDTRLTLLNPRRSDWNEYATDEEVRAQIHWELTAQTQSALNVYAFTTNSLAPVTMLELGVYGSRKPASCVVCMEPGFYRSVNIEVTCAELGVTVVKSFDELIRYIRAFFRFFE